MLAEEKENCKDLEDTREVEKNAGTGVVWQAYLLTQISQRLSVLLGKGYAQ